MIDETKLLEEIETKKKNAERLIVEPPHDKLDEIQNDISSGYIAACDELVETIHELLQ